MKILSNIQDASKIVTTSSHRFVSDAEKNKWNKVDNKSDKGHKHSKSDITDFPSSLPANGGNADTLDGKHASDFQQLTNGGAYGIFPSTASTMIGNEYNILLYAYKRGYTITQSGSTTLDLASLFDGLLAPTYSPNGVNPNDPLIITISGLPDVHTQTGGVFGWTCRYWYPSKYKIEAYDTHENRGWKTLIDKSNVDTPTKELLIPIYPDHAGTLTAFRITIYDSSVGNTGSNGYRRVGISEIFFCHPEAVRVNQYLDYLYAPIDHVHDLIKIDTNITLYSSNWVDDTSNSGYWIYTINDSEVTSNTVVDVNIHLSSIDDAAGLESVTQSFNGYYRLYAKNKPAANIIVDVKKTKQG